MVGFSTVKLYLPLYNESYVVTLKVSKHIISVIHMLILTNIDLIFDLLLFCLNLYQMIINSIDWNNMSKINET